MIMDGSDWFNEKRRADLFVWACPLCGKIGIGADYRINHLTNCTFSKKMNK